MSRLINADGLIGELHNTTFENGDDRAMVYRIIENQPTIEERKTGRWIDITKTGGDFVWKCSECGELNLEDTYFCPNCGVKMEVEHD